METADQPPILSATTRQLSLAPLALLRPDREAVWQATEIKTMAKAVWEVMARPAEVAVAAAAVAAVAAAMATVAVVAAAVATVAVVAAAVAAVVPAAVAAVCQTRLYKDTKCWNLHKLVSLQI
jgi:hypothetical protein